MVLAVPAGVGGDVPLTTLAMVEFTTEPSAGHL